MSRRISSLKNLECANLYSQVEDKGEIDAISGLSASRCILYLIRLKTVSMNFKTHPTMGGKKTTRFGGSGISAIPISFYSVEETISPPSSS